MAKTKFDIKISKSKVEKIAFDAVRPTNKEVYDSAPSHTFRMKKKYEEEIKDEYSLEDEEIEKGPLSFEERINSILNQSN